MTNTQFNTFTNSSASPNLSHFFTEIKPLYVYTRQQAIGEGILIDVTEAKESKNARIGYPVAVTATVWDAYIEWTDRDNKRQCYQLTLRSPC